MIKGYETCGIKYKCCDCFLEYTNFKDGLIEHKCSSCNKSYQRKLDGTFKEKIHAHFQTMITVSLFYCCKNVFILTNIWMIYQ